MRLTYFHWRPTDSRGRPSILGVYKENLRVSNENLGGGGLHRNSFFFWFTWCHLSNIGNPIFTESIGHPVTRRNSVYIESIGHPVTRRNCVYIESIGHPVTRRNCVYIFKMLCMINPIQILEIIYCLVNVTQRLIYSIYNCTCSVIN